MNEINLYHLCENPTLKIQADFTHSYGDTIREKIDWIFTKIQQVGGMLCSSMGCGSDQVFIVVNSDDPLFGGMCKLVEDWDVAFDDPPRWPFEPVGKIMLTRQDVYRSDHVPKGSFLVVADYDKTHPKVQAGLLTFKNWLF